MRPVGVLPIYSAAMRKTLRILIVPALVLALAVPALAVTTYSTGDWKGTTAQKNGKGKHRKLTFYADSTTGEVTKLAFDLQLGTYRPNVLWTERRLGTDQFTLIPRNGLVTG